MIGVHNSGRSRTLDFGLRGRKLDIGNSFALIDGRDLLIGLRFKVPVVALPLRVERVVSAVHVRGECHVCGHWLSFSLGEKGQAQLFPIMRVYVSRFLAIIELTRFFLQCLFRALSGLGFMMTDLMLGRHCHLLRNLRHSRIRVHWAVHRNPISWRRVVGWHARNHVSRRHHFTWCPLYTSSLARIVVRRVIRGLLVDQLVLAHRLAERWIVRHAIVRRVRRQLLSIRHLMVVLVSADTSPVWNRLRSGRMRLLWVSKGKLSLHEYWTKLLLLRRLKLRSNVW